MVILMMENVIIMTRMSSQNMSSKPENKEWVKVSNRRFFLYLPQLAFLLQHALNERKQAFCSLPSVMFWLELTKPVQTWRFTTIGARKGFSLTIGVVVIAIGTRGRCFGHLTIGLDVLLFVRHQIGLVLAVKYYNGRLGFIVGHLFWFWLRPITSQRRTDEILIIFKNNFGDHKNLLETAIVGLSWNHFSKFVWIQ